MMCCWRLRTEIQIVDARSADRFQALAPDPRPACVQAIFPQLQCAVEYPVENGIFKSPTQIQQIFRDAGVDLSKYRWCPAVPV